MNRYIFIVLLIISFTQVQAQSTVISGKVTDASSNEPIMFCNVFFVGTKIGTMTDFEGNYKLETKNALDSLTVQALGYASRIKPIKKGIKQTLNFQIKPSNITLEEIVILPGENPAYRVLRGVWENKKKYNPDKIETYKYESYTKIEIALSNVSEKFKNSTAMKPFKGVLDSLKKKAGEDGQIVLPMITSETIDDYYFQKSPKYEKEYVKASKSKALINVTDILKPFMGSGQHKYNFYNNWVSLMDKPFTSPISTTGRLFYRYYLEDSLDIEGVNCYMIKFKPKRKGDLAFTGKMWITKEGYILKKITAEVSNRANFNFVDRYKIEQELEFIDSSVVFPVQARVLIDASRFTSNYGILAKYNLGYQDIKINPEIESKTFTHNQEFAYDSEDQTEEYWDEKREDLVGDSTIADQSYTIIDSLSQSKSIKRVSNFLDFAYEGYLPTKYFEFGHYMFALGYNKDEGFRTQLGGRTTVDFSKKWILTGHLAYGFHDKKVKYDVQVERFLSRKYWTKVGFSHRYDIDKIGVNDNFISQNPFMAFSLAISSQFGGTQHTALGNDFNAWISSDLGRGFQGSISLKHYKFRPYGSFAFGYFDKEGTLQNQYILSDVNFMLRYAKKELFIYRKNDRIGLGDQKGFVYTFNYTAGLKDVLESSFNYHKLSLNIKRKLKIGGLGRLQLSFTGTKVFGDVPTTLLKTLQGNESFFISYKGFNLMGFSEFITDQSIEVMSFHHFDGLLFNKVPLLRALNLRSTVGANVAFGTFQDQYEYNIPQKDIHGQDIDQFTHLKPNKPYLEVSVGIENIFKFFSIQYVRRLTYIKEDKAPYAIKIAADIVF